VLCCCLTAGGKNWYLSMPVSISGGNSSRKGLLLLSQRLARVQSHRRELSEKLLEPKWRQVQHTTVYKCLRYRCGAAKITTRHTAIIYYETAGCKLQFLLLTMTVKREISLELTTSGWACQDKLTSRIAIRRAKRPRPGQACHDRFVALTTATAQQL
jgi:hypothetical protein